MKNINVIDGIFVIKVKENNKQKLIRWLGGAKHPDMVNIKADLWFTEYEEGVFYIQENERLIMLDELAEENSGALCISFEYYGSSISQEEIKAMSSYLGVSVKMLLV
ncbi:hypothetical protein D5B42_23205 [Salmonella enterica subsp. enterica serovar Oranienburg]|nr:hypothetical protein [Salmonella enterica subsp. enterica serovar Oranienburg]